MSLDSIQKNENRKDKGNPYTHPFGNMVDVTDIIEYCKEHKIYFIEDAPQSIGSVKGTKAGSVLTLQFL